jgi:membrane protein implicated in regulation of membrane protease activity
MSSQSVIALVWLVSGFVLLLGEALMPGLVMGFFGLGAIIVSLLAMAGLDSLALQFVAFSLISIGMLLVLRRRFVGNVHKDLGHDEDIDGIGQVVQAAVDFDGRHGRVCYRGANWDARCDDPSSVRSGDYLVIVGREGLCLTVRPERASNRPQSMGAV